MAIRTQSEFNEQYRAFWRKWGEKLLSGNTADFQAALREAKPLAKWGKVRPERILVGAAARWEEHRKEQQK